ncbi:EF-hand domain-containing protein [Methylovorus sp. MM2]|uniref:EF-hand domain-containing protein n=1 Tax=Methylovorus sp. MM2 TaxID=1848038 RepID=UPI000834B499|nr:EF-hand domain-containing protein [Methylovorus sp. MM2]
MQAAKMKVMTLKRGAFSTSFQQRTFLTVCTLLAFNAPLLAAPDDVSVAKPVDAAGAQSSSSGKPLKSLISIEESIKLRNDINEYSRTVDPAHVQIEERRRVMHQRLQKRFQQADIDNSKSISRDEAALYMPQIARHFDSIDTNDDGVITLDELEALQVRILERQRNDAERKVLEDLEPAPKPNETVEKSAPASKKRP